MQGEPFGGEVFHFVSRRIVAFGDADGIITAGNRPRTVHAPSRQRLAHRHLGCKLPDNDAMRHGLLHCLDGAEVTVVQIEQVE